ncbi:MULTISPECIES: prolipoprotein diacylglyceryl transferase [unclassified Gilliamella]|uniref:prolipoprotein diacylglyceryl transferase n=1 Tax=unclassified Gilliamella TaxID=2685620 RepID=UPI0013089B8D|nr:MULTISPECIES: prolipoprotein diacylglyceryl transferase [unclassified Gilliamella]MWP49403.1 prolipoprotein diacylglyceryl transferase [Gilliamella sp. Lep-s35]MWP69176.1 prolipoprotein diacylglyceryl transferase [Gilliamella sp. Lep-s5]MWP77394.1 prolipoprotein diacylglyceryl transferase [Gilliamella sp. Lep-s21]
MNQYLQFPNFDPIAFSIGPISLHWYGAMYLFGVLGALYLAKRRANKPNSKWTSQQVENLLFWGFLGLFIGGRLGYVFFYNFDAFIKDPVILFKVWEGGMSFHGGLIGSICVIAIFAKKAKKTFMEVGDFVAPLVPIGLMFGRFGNFINGELWGRVTNLPIGMLFPTSAHADFMFVQSHPEWFSLYSQLNGILPRHPSQLYEMLFEGILLFIILNIFIRKPRPAGAASGLFLLCYGLFRFVIEFFRQPDEQLGLFLNIISMGQILCLPMIIGGILILLFAYRFNNKAKTQ